MTEGKLEIQALSTDSGPGEIYALGTCAGIALGREDGADDGDIHGIRD